MQLITVEIRDSVINLCKVMNHCQIAKITGLPRMTIANISRGYYDFLQENPNNSKDIQIDNYLNPGEPFSEDCYNFGMATVDFLGDLVINPDNVSRFDKYKEYYGK